MKKTKKLDFQFAILLSSEVPATQPDPVAPGIASRLDSLIMGLVLKFLGVVKILLIYSHKVLEFEI